MFGICRAANSQRRKIRKCNRNGKIKECQSERLKITVNYGEPEKDAYPNTARPKTAIEMRRKE